MKKLITIFSFAICFFFIGSLHAQTNDTIPNGNIKWPTNTMTPPRWGGVLLNVKSGSSVTSIGMAFGARSAEYGTLPYQFVCGRTASHLTDGSAAAIFKSDTGSITTPEQKYLFLGVNGPKVTTPIPDIFPGIFFSGNFVIDFTLDQTKFLNYYGPLLNVFDITKNPNFKPCNLTTDYASILLPYIQDKPKITGKKPTKVNGYFKYTPADYKIVDWDTTGSDWPSIVAYAVKDSTFKREGDTTTYFSSFIVAKGAMPKLPEKKDYLAWTEFSIDLVDIDDSTKHITPSHVIILCTSSANDSVMRNAFKNRNGGQRSTLYIDDVTTNGELDVNLNFNYPSGLEFEVVPSLSNGQVTVNLPTETADVTIYNTQGKVVLKKTCKNGETLNIDNSGAYIVKAIAKGQQGIRKISVVK